MELAGTEISVASIRCNDMSVHNSTAHLMMKNRIQNLQVSKLEIRGFLSESFSDVSENDKFEGNRIFPPLEECPAF